MAMNFQVYNRSLLDILQKFSSNPDFKDLVEEYLDLGELAYNTNPATTMLYKKSGPLLGRFAPRIFARDMTLMDAQWPEMFSPWISKVGSLPTDQQAYVWTKLGDALVATGHSPPAPSPSTPVLPAPVVPSTPVLPAPDVKNVPLVSVAVTPAAAAAVREPMKTERAAKGPMVMDDDEIKRRRLKEVVKNPQLRSAARAVRTYMNKRNVDGKGKEAAAAAAMASAPDMKAMMDHLKSIGAQSSEAFPTDKSEKAGPDVKGAEGSGDDGGGFFFKNAPLFSQLTGLIQTMMEDRPETAVPEAPKTDLEKKQEEDTRKIVANLSMAQQFHVSFFKHYKALAEYRGQTFSQLVVKYRELAAYLRDITNLPEGPKEYTLLEEVVTFFKTNKRAIRRRDEKLFTQPTHPVLQELDSPAIWASLESVDEREQFWNWMEEIQNIAVTAHICTGDTAGFEVIAKQVLPSICRGIQAQDDDANADATTTGPERLMKQFVEALSKPEQMRSVRQLIDNFGKDPSQVNKALEMISTLVGEDDDETEENGQATTSASASASEPPSATAPSA